MIGDFAQDNFRHHRRRSSFSGNQTYGYGDTYGTGHMSTSPREQTILRAQSRRGSMHGMNPMMGRTMPGGASGSMYDGMAYADQHQSPYPTRFDQDPDDLEYCRPRGSTIGDFDLHTRPNHRRQSSFPVNQMYGYGDPYGMGPMSVSPREHMMRAQLMRSSMYGMDPMMGRMAPGGAYGMDCGGMGYGLGPSMFGPGSPYGYAPRPMMGMGSIMGTGYPGVGIRPYRMSGFVDTHSPHLMKAKTWSAYGRLM